MFIRKIKFSFTEKTTNISQRRSNLHLKGLRMHKNTHFATQELKKNSSLTPPQLVINPFEILSLRLQKVIIRLCSAGKLQQNENYRSTTIISHASLHYFFTPRALRS